MKHKKMLLGMGLALIILATTVFGALTWYFTSQPIPKLIKVIGIEAGLFQMTGDIVTFDNYRNKILATSFCEAWDNSLALAVYAENFYNLTLKVDLTLPEEINETLGIECYMAWTQYFWYINQQPQDRNIAYFNDAGTLSTWYAGNYAPPTDKTVFRDISNAVNINNVTSGYTVITKNQKAGIMYDSTLPIVGSGNQPQFANCNAVTLFFLFDTEYCAIGNWNITATVSLGSI